jgi:hypothetical protein
MLTRYAITGAILCACRRYVRATLCAGVREVGVRGETGWRKYRDRGTDFISRVIWRIWYDALRIRIQASYSAPNASRETE